MEEKVLQLGERRAITLKIWLKDNAAFTPQNCEWDLSYTDSKEAQGTILPEQDGAYWNLRCEIQPKRIQPYLYLSGWIGNCEKSNSDSGDLIWQKNRSVPVSFQHGPEAKFYQVARVCDREIGRNRIS